MKGVVLEYTMTELFSGYTAAQVEFLLGNANISMSTFYRLVREGVIEKFLPEGRVQDALYNKVQVDDLVEGGTPSRRKRKKTSRRQSPSLPQALKLEVRESREQSQADTDWIQQNDLPYVYVLDTELYGVENSVSPTTTWTWWQKNPHACRILFNKHSRKDVWGALTVIPMREEIIFRLLAGEMKEAEITPEQVLPYEPGHQYTCYVASVAMRPEHRQHFGRLLHSFLDFWYEQYPGVQITRLYGFALGGEDSDGVRLIRKLYFAPRYDIGDGENIYELRLDHYNPSPIIQQFQQSLREKLAEQKENNPISRTKTAAGHTPKQAISTSFETAAKEEIAACVAIDEAIFGESPITPFDEQIQTRQGWREANGLVFHVLKANGEIVGYYSMIPLPRQKIERILREEEHPRDIRPEDIRQFEPGQPLDVYVVVMGIKPGFPLREKRIFGSSLMRGMMGVFRELGERGVAIRTIFGRSRLEEGIELLEQVGFRELDYSPVNEKKLYFLDVEQANTPLLREYKQALATYYLHQQTR
jgi:hypothetical protein